MAKANFCEEIMIYFLIPTYNESLNIQNLSLGLNEYIARSDVFFVFSDDCSTDDTIQIIPKYINTNNLKVLSSSQNLGPGAVFNKGFNWILDNYKSEKDIVVTMEADSSSDVGILRTMLLLQKEGYDLVLASVYAQGGGFSKTSIFRRVISFIANIFLRLAFNIKVLTLSSFYRVYSIKKLKDVKERYKEIITENGFVCMVEVLIKFIKVKAKVIEVPMTLKSEDRIGKSKMKISETSIQYMKFLIKSKLR